ncbi:MAG: alpha-amylase family glycosyl hydrolase, partial [Armatimonadetes bacterium]|nr:alpha-amylase family glycosyl hydrolase [Armatimonadota bacterium]
ATGTELLAGATRPLDLRTDSGSAFTASAARAARLGALVLDGQWDFRIEGGEWQKLTVPGAWEDQGVTQVTPNDPDPGWKPYNGNGYYRRAFDLPENLRGRGLVLVLQRVDDWDVVTLNGREIGRTGQEVTDWWAVPRRYPVPADALKPGDNLLEIKVYDRGGEGGLLGSVILMPADLVPEWEKPLRLASAQLQVEGGLAQVTLTYDAPGWQVSEVYEVAVEGPGFLSRRVVLVPGEEAGREVIRGGELELGRLGAQVVAEGQLAVPYTWPPVLGPLSDFARAGDVGLHCGSAVTGVGICLPSRDLAFAVGQYWEQDWNTFYCRGRDGAVTLGGDFQCEGRLRPGLRIPMGGQFILVSNSPSADWRAATRAIGDGWRKLGFTRPPLPHWAESIALYSAYPGGTMGGNLADLRDPSGKEPPLQTFRRLQLPILKRLGINAIWLLPIWPGLYGPTDYFKIDPSLGSLDDFRAFVQDAHSAGIRVLCDLIPHGPQEVSGLAQERPELIARHEDGSILYWWGCLCCDYAHPGWHDYMARVATYWMREADIDGYRVDCAGGAPQNWRPYGDNLPSWSGQWGGLRMMEKVRAEMEKVKPDCVLLAEAANPPMLSQAQYIYDWPTETVLFHILDTPREEWVAGLRTWLELQRLALPEGAARGLMRFTENHDQLHSVWQLGPDLARPIWALCALAEGFPLLYHEQEVGFEDFWADLLAVRKALPELHLGAADYVGVTCDKPDVLAFSRTYQGRASLVVINFSGTQQECDLTWPDAPKGLTRAVAFPHRERVNLGAEKGVKVRVSVPKGGWRVVALRAEGETVSVSETGFEPRPLGPQPVTWQ